MQYCNEILALYGDILGHDVFYCKRIVAFHLTCIACKKPGLLTVPMKKVLQYQCQYLLSKTIADNSGDTAIIKYCQYQYQKKYCNSLSTAILLSYTYVTEGGGVKRLGWNRKSVLNKLISR